MAKDGKNAGVSVLVLIGALLYLYVGWQAWNTLGNGSLLGATMAASDDFLATASAVAWAVALLASIGLLFGSLGSFAWGWFEQTVNMAMKGGEYAGVALLVVAIGLGGAGTWATWAGIVVVGFILNWLGVAMAWGQMMGKK